MNIPLLIADYNGNFLPLFLGVPTAIAAIVFVFVAGDRLIMRRNEEAKIPAIIAIGLSCLCFAIYYFGKKYGP